MTCTANKNPDSQARLVARSRTVLRLELRAIERRTRAQARQRRLGKHGRLLREARIALASARALTFALAEVRASAHAR